MKKIINPNKSSFISKIILCDCGFCGGTNWYSYKNEFIATSKYKKCYFLPDIGPSKLDGPAKRHIIYSDNYDYYDFYINGVYFPTYLFARKTNHIKCRNCLNFCKQKCFL